MSKAAFRRMCRREWQRGCRPECGRECGRERRSPVSGKRSRGAAASFLATLFLALPLAAFAAQNAPELVEFSIPEQRADRALTTFAQQAGLSVLFPFDEVSRVSANALSGPYRLEDALARLLADTDLVASIEPGGRLIVQLRPPPREQSPGLLARLLARLSPATGESAEPEPERELLEEITVTGSRIRRQGFHSAQPTLLVGAEMLALPGLSNGGDALALVPANLGNWTPTAKPGGNESVPLNVFNGLNLANLRGLNPVYGSRTLTLVDSRRHTPTNQGDGVDLNMIPAILVDRLEVVTGGASASYGSGAIGGVVNLLLDRDIEGLRSELSFATTARGDGNDRYYGLAWGGGLGRQGRLTLALETQDMDPIVDCVASRDWCARGASLRENRAFASNGQPHFVYRENVRLDMSTRGLLPRQGLEFDASGTALTPYQVADPFQVGGDGQHIYQDTTLRTNVDRDVVFARYERDLSADSYLLLEATLGEVRSWTPQDGIDLFGARLAPDNFFLQRLASNPCAQSPDACFINKDFSAQLRSVNDTRTALRRFALGLGGRLGESSWTWDAYYQRGASDMRQWVHDARHALRMQFALDAVDDGSGQPVCRVLRDGIDPAFGGDPRLAEGCVPLPLFGTAPLAAEVKAYSWGRILDATQVRQELFDVVSSGELGAGWGGGPLRAALGVNWRGEAMDNLADLSQPDYLRTDYNSQFGESYGGRVEVSEVFAELELPLTTDFAVQLAARHSHYANRAGFGTRQEGRRFSYDIDTWKVNARWTPRDWLVLRASQSRDLRAPNFRELYYGKVFQRGSLFGYCDNPWTGNRFEGWYTGTGDPCRAELRGGSDLRPEQADTTTWGLVLSPPGSSLRLALDFHRIRITDAITPASWDYTIAQCHLERAAEFCALIEGPLLDPADPLGGFARLDVVSSTSLNQLRYETRGVDLSGAWSREFGGGLLSLRLLATHTLQQRVQPDPASPALLDIAGVTGSPDGGFDWEAAPDWSLQGVASYARGPFTLSLHSRYLSAGRKDASRRGPGEAGYLPGSAGSIDDNRVPSHLLWGFSGAVDFRLLGARAQLFGAVENLFDKDPPLVGTGIAGTNPVLFDTLGRRFRAGLRVGF